MKCFVARRVLKKLGGRMELPNHRRVCRFRNFLWHVVWMPILSTCFIRTLTKPMSGLADMAASDLQAVKRLLEEEFPGIQHVTTTSMNKKVSTCRHDFLPVAGNLNKMDVLVQVKAPLERLDERRSMDVAC